MEHNDTHMSGCQEASIPMAADTVPLVTCGLHFGTNDHGARDRTCEPCATLSKTAISYHMRGVKSTSDPGRIACACQDLHDMNTPSVRRAPGQKHAIGFFVYHR